MTSPSLALGVSLPLEGRGAASSFGLATDHLLTHGVVVGMTGSGKTGLVTVLAEEALRARVPTLMIDVKGDLPNLLLAPPSFAASALAPWFDEGEAAANGDAAAQASLDHMAHERETGLREAGVDEGAIASFRTSSALRVLTPGSTIGEPVHLLASLERRSPLWASDPESARASLCAAVSLVLRLLGRDPDPAKSREHVLLSVLAERRLVAGESADLVTLLADVQSPPIETIGAMSVDSFVRASERRALAAAMNSLLASPTFATWRTGASLDVGAWLSPRDGRTPGVILSVAHLDDDERLLVLSLVFEELLAWVRSLPGTRKLRALVVFDEAYGFLPPHPANPPTKKPIVALLKQARAFGVGVVVATQNPMDLDYRALGNAGVWCIGRLQTDADRARVVEGLADAGVFTSDKERAKGGGELDATIKRLAPRWFVVRDARAERAVLMRPRQTISLLRGPMTRVELQRAVGRAAEGREPTSGPAVGPTGPGSGPDEEISCLGTPA